MRWEKFDFTVSPLALPLEYFNIFFYLSNLTMKTSYQLSSNIKTAILELRKAGLSHRKIALQLGYSNCTISNFLRQYDSTGDMNRKLRSGGGRKSTAEDDAALEKLSLADRFRTANELRADWKKSRGVKVSRVTVNRRLLSFNLPAMTPRKKPLLDAGQRQRRLTFAQRYQHWTSRDWKRVVFSDETWMELFSHQGKRFVRRRQGEEMLPECVVKSVKHPAKIMCWGAITPEGTSSLIWIDSNCNAAKYIETLGKAKLPNFLRQHSHPRPLFMQDGAPGHRARCTQRKDLRPKRPGH